MSEGFDSFAYALFYMERRGVLKASELKQYLRSAYTTIDKKSYLRTFQVYYDPVKGKRERKV